MEQIVAAETIEILDRLQQDLRDLVESLKAPKEPAAKAQQEPEKPAKKTTLEEVRAVLVEKSRAGKTGAVRELLEHFNASSLPEVDPANYADLLALGKEL